MKRRRAGTVSAAIVWALLLAAGSAPAQNTPPSPSRSTFVALTEVQELWEQEDYATAEARLNELVEKVRGNAYEYAVANQYLANTRILSGDTEGARLAVEQAIGVGDIPMVIRADLDLFYGQLLLGDEEYATSVEHLERWLETVLENPTLIAPPQPKQLFYVAYANYMDKNLARARELMERSIAEAPEPNPQWERVYYQVLYELDEFDLALDVLLQLLEWQPEEDDNWRLLANHYMQQEQHREGLAAMLLANFVEPMTSEADLRRLVNMFGYVDIPERAARMLEQHIDSGKITADPQTLRQLGDLWLMAREREKAKVALQKAADAAPDGRTYRLLGGIYFEDEEWESAYSAFLEALDLGGLNEPFQVRLLAGISAYRAGMTNEARVALQAAAEDEDLRPQAEALLRRL